MCNSQALGQTNHRDILKIIKKGAIHMSMINKEIGDFKSYAFHEKEFKMVSKEDILGKWNVFFFYPAEDRKSVV